MSACPGLPLWPAVTLILPPLDASGRLQEDPHDFSSVCVPMALGVSRPNGAPPAGSRLLCSARRPAPRLPVSSLPGRPVALWTISSPHCVVATGASPAFGRGVFSHTVPEPKAGGPSNATVCWCPTGDRPLNPRRPRRARLERAVATTRTAGWTPAGDASLQPSVRPTTPGLIAACPAAQPMRQFGAPRVAGHPAIRTPDQALRAPRGCSISDLSLPRDRQ